MALYLLKNLTAKTVKGANALIVSAESEALAKTFAGAYFNGDSGWGGATAVALTEGTLDDNASMLGYTWKVSLRGAAAQTGDNAFLEATVTGSGTDDLDAIAAKIVTALNALPLIANASYSAPNLTVSSIADGLGDATVIVKVYGPSGDTSVDLSSLFTGTITHEGVAAAALVVALKADTVAKPAVLAEVQV